jgi:hypothetical protein
MQIKLTKSVLEVPSFLTNYYIIEDGDSKIYLSISKIGQDKWVDINDEIGFELKDGLIDCTSFNGMMFESDRTVNDDSIRLINKTGYFKFVLENGRFKVEVYDANRNYVDSIHWCNCEECYYHMIVYGNTSITGKAVDFYKPEKEKKISLWTCSEDKYYLRHCEIKCFE